MKNQLNFNDSLLWWIGWPLGSLLISLLLFHEQWLAFDLSFISICLPIAFLYTAIFWILCRRSYIYVLNRYPERRDFTKRMAWMFLAFLVIFCAVNLILEPLILAVFPDRAFQSSVLVEFVAAFIISALVISAYEILRFMVQLESAEHEKTMLQAQNIQSQLEGLRNQVNPHFLFNSLNTLTYLIPENQEKAVRFVQQLSQVYRYILDSRDDKIIPIQEELDFLESYIFLLRERFGENLRIEMHDLCNGENCAIVPLSLQMLFENAIKHNVISKSQPLDIQVFVENHGMENEAIIVQNSLQRKSTVSDSTGVGLENIADRYRILTGKSIRVEEGNGLYRVSIPLIRMGAV